MTPPMTSLLLLAALVIWYIQTRAASLPRVDRCPHCADLVQHVPGWLIRCPACRRFFIA